MTNDTHTPPHTNAEILAAVFAPYEPLPGGAMPQVTGFAGPPAKARGTAWAGERYRPGVSVDGEPLNRYYTLATYTPTTTTKTAKDCRAIVGVMLDDIGTEKTVPLSRLDACPPSYTIETSPGNFQCVYLFDRPLTDTAAVTALHESMVLSGLCDPGAKSPATRWGRLPFSVNGKHDPAFNVRLVEFHPERRYTIDQIYDALELARKPKASRAAPLPHNTEDDLYVPVGENPVLVKLKEAGLYKRLLPVDGQGRRKHDLKCPWVQDHSDGLDSGTCYMEPDSQYPLGGFACLHSHGSALHIRDLLTYLGIDTTTAKHRPTIRLAAGALPQNVSDAEKLLAKSGNYFQRADSIVTVVTTPGTNETTIREVRAPALMVALSNVAIFQRYTPQKTLVQTDPSDRLIQSLASATNYGWLPPLQGLAHQPHLRTDGSLVTTPGYDDETMLYGVFNTDKYQIANKPTKADAAAALGELMGLLNEFSFITEADRAAALAAILTAAIRAALPLAPMVHIRAPSSGSGKSYLSQLIAAFASAAMAQAQAFPSREEESEKVLLSSLLPAPAVLLFDNLTTDIQPFKMLCSMLTEPRITGRVLGASRTASVSTRVLVLSNGINVGPTADMARRVLTINLDPMSERPAEREYHAHPVELVRGNRERFVSLALTVVRAWIVAGRPVTQCPPLGSFGVWRELCTQPLMWLGLPDPAANVFAALTDDPNKAELSQVLHAWHASFGKEPLLVREVLGSFDMSDDLREALTAAASDKGVISPVRLGYWLKRHAGRIVGGLRLVPGRGGKASAARWAVEPIAQRTAPPVSADCADLFDIAA